MTTKQSKLHRLRHTKRHKMDCVKNTAIILVVTVSVLGIKFAVLKSFAMKIKAVTPIKDAIKEI